MFNKSNKSLSIEDTNDVWDVEQENSIDKVDRIAFAIAKIKKLVQENMSV